jgi:hypothetical protein
MRELSISGLEDRPGILEKLGISRGIFGGKKPDLADRIVDIIAIVEADPVLPM